MKDFWDFSVARYALPGVKAAALDLQDRQGFDINIALWCVWLAEQGRQPGRALEPAIAEARDWQSRITGPLRQMRRAVKDEAGQLDLYQRLLEAELEAEHVLEDSLAKLLPETGVTSAPARQAAASALMAYAGQLGRTGEFDAFLCAVFPAGETV